jgi:hypothetical protein
MSRLQIKHPQPGATVVSNFLVAQGDGDPAIRNLIGIIWDASGMVVAVGMALANPPHWLIPFEHFTPGQGYCLEIIDANTRQRLACVGPFDANPAPPVHGPTVFFPAMGATISTNMAAYGQAAGVNPLEGMISGPNGNTLWVPQSQGPPNTPFWVISFSNVPANAAHTSKLTVREQANHVISTDVNNLAVV